MFSIIKSLAGLNGNNAENLLDYLENPKSKQCQNAVFIIINMKTAKYDGLDIEEISEEKKIQYLYPIKANRPPNGINQTPSIVYNSYDKSYEKKVYSWFFANKDKSEFFKSVFNILEDFKDEIKKDLDTKQNEQGFKTFLLSLKIDGRYIGDIEDFKSLIIDEDKIVEQISGKYGKTSMLSDAYCSVCMQKKDNVYGFSIPFTFFNVDNESFAYGFNKSSAVKQYPVCLECAKQIRGKGRGYLASNLLFDDLCNNKYYLLPELLNTSDTETFENYLNKIKRYRENAAKNKNNENRINTSTIGEKILLEDLQDTKNALAFTLLFFKMDSSKFNILAAIEDVLPSNLTKLYDAINKEQEHFYENDIKVRDANNGKEEERVLFSYNIIRNFFENQKVSFKNRSKKQFFEVLDAVFNFKKLEYQYLMRVFVSNSIQYRKTFLNSFLFLNILLRLKITSGGKSKMSESNKTSILDGFCMQFPDFFKSPLKRAIFGIGVLTEQLAICQNRVRGNKAIYKSLKRFKLDRKYITEKVYVNVQGKSQYYEFFPKAFANKLSQEVDEYIFQSVKEKITSQEASYIFMSGIHLSYKVKEKFNPKKTEELKNESN